MQNEVTVFRFPDYHMAQFQSVWGKDAKYRICTSTLQPMLMAEIIDSLSATEAKEWQQLSLGYSTDRGDAALRVIIAEDYPGLCADDIVVFAGAQEASFCAMYALLGPDGLALRGDAQPTGAAKVSAILPCFEPLLALPQSLGADIQTTNLLPTESGWELPLDQLLSTYSDNLALSIINFPGNPTGALISKEAQANIIKCLANIGAWLFSDEVFRGLEYDPADQLPTAASLYEKAVSLGSIAKPYGLGGVRVGWLASQNKSFIDRVIRIKRSLSICTGYVDEWLAKAVLQRKAALQDKNRVYMAQQLEIIQQSLSDVSQQLLWIPPRAGIIAYPALKSHPNGELFAQALVKERGVLLLPGSSFSGDFPQHVRLGFGLHNFAEGWALFCAALLDSAAD